MNGTNTIPSLTIALPETGQTVVLNKYLTTGQSRELQRILLEEGKVNVETGSIENISPATFMKMQDKAAEFLIRGTSEGEDIKPFSKDWLDSLPVADGNLLYEKINELTNASNLNPEVKKK